MATTRYPKQGRGSRWTELALKAVPVEWKGDYLSDGDGLNGEVRVSADGRISVNFKYGYKWQGAGAKHYCGTWPDVGLAAIRTERDRARQQLKQGVDPSEKRKADRLEAQAQIQAVVAEAARQEAENLPLREMYEAWMRDGVARADGNAELRRSFEKDVLPAIGSKPVREVTEHDLRSVLRAMAARGVHRMSVRT